MDKRKRTIINTRLQNSFQDENIKKLKLENNNIDNNNHNNSNNNNNNNDDDNNDNNSKENMNNSNNEYNDFINSSIDEWTVRELKLYANKIGVDITKVTKKKDIFEKILNYILYQKSILDEQNEKENINSFNKQQPELINIEALSSFEISFWKVFRNMVIFKKIFSNFKLKQLYSYDRLYSLGHIFDDYTNGIEIIKDKVKSNSYLHFDHPEIIFENINFSSNYIGIGDINDNSNSVVNNGGNENENSTNGVDTGSINGSGYDNCDQDIKSFYVTLFQNYFKYEDNVKIINYCLEYCNVLALSIFNQDDEILKLKNSIEIIIEDLNGFRMFKYLDNLIGSKNFSAEISLYNLYQSSIKLKDIIEIVQILVQSSNLNTSTEFKKIKILFKSFTNDQLNSTLEQLLEQYSDIIQQEKDHRQLNIKETKQSIYEIISYYYTLIKIPQEKLPLQYYLLLRDSEDIKFKLSKMATYHFNSGFGYDSFESFVKLFKFKIKVQFFTNLLKEFTRYKVLLEYWLKSVIRLGNIELLELYIKEFSIKYLSNNIITIYRGLKSTHVLDYLFKNYKSFFENHETQSQYWVHFSSINVLERFEIIMKSMGVKLVLKNKLLLFTYFFDKDKEDIILQLIYRIVTKPDSYSIQIDSLDGFSLGIGNSLRNSINNQDYLISLYKLSYKLNLNSISIDPPIKISRFADWYITNNSNSGSSIYNETVRDLRVYLKLLYISGHYEELFKLNCSIIKYQELMDGFSETKRIQYNYNLLITPALIDHLFSYIKSNNIKINLNNLEDYELEQFHLKKLLLSLVRTANLNVLQHISIKYNYLLVKSSKSNPNGTDPKLLKEVYIEAIKTNYEISKIFSTTIQLTRTEIEKNNLKSYPWFEL